MIHQAESRREKKSTRVTPHFLSLALDCSRLLAARAFRYAAPLSASRARHRAGHHDRRHRGQEAVRRCPAEERRKTIREESRRPFFSCTREERLLRAPRRRALALLRVLAVFARAEKRPSSSCAERGEKRAAWNDGLERRIKKMTTLELTIHHHPLSSQTTTTLPAGPLSPASPSPAASSSRLRRALPVRVVAVIGEGVKESDKTSERER